MNFWSAIPFGRLLDTGEYPKRPYQQKSQWQKKLNYFFLTFLKIASNGLPDGQDGQVRAGSSSHTDPDGLDQY